MDIGDAHRQSGRAVRPAGAGAADPAAHGMQKLMRQKGNMTVHTWRISICVSIHIDIHPKLYMHSNGCPLYRVKRI